MIEQGSPLAAVYERANTTDKVALIEAREAHDIALAQARRAARWHDVVADEGQSDATDAARRLALAAYQVADDTFEAMKNAMLLADARAELAEVVR